MRELKCPKCGAGFTVDEADYAMIVSQVKNAEFEKELSRRAAEIEKHQEALRQASELKTSQSLRAELAEWKNTAERLRAELKAEMAGSKNREKIAVLEVQRRADDLIRRSATELERARTDLEMANTRAELEKKSLMEEHAGELRRLRDERDYYKDLKAKLSTKMLGESLEVHCSTEFNRVRTRMYPYAYFDKDVDFN